MSLNMKRQGVSNAPFLGRGSEREVRWNVGPGEPSVFHVLADGSQTGRRCAIAVHELEPGAVGPLHAHEIEDEGLYVLEGDITFQMPEDGIEIEATKGEFVWQPNQRVHGFQVGDKPVRLLQFVFPGTDLIPNFFEEAAESETPEEIEAFTKVAYEKYGQVLFGPDGWTPAPHAEATRGPLTPDARLLYPSESEGVVNRPFKSDLATIHKLNIDRGIMTDLECIFHCFGHQTGNAFGMMEIEWTEPGLIPPHVHALDEEGFYVLEGEMRMHCATREGPIKLVAQPGDMIWAPREMPHSAITGPEGARILAFEVPGGSLMEYFAGIAIDGRGSDFSTDEKLQEFSEWQNRVSASPFLVEGEWPGKVPGPQD
jgi:quercetin dioxygenase-like cupin family protein